MIKLICGLYLGVVTYWAIGTVGHNVSGAITQADAGKAILWLILTMFLGYMAGRSEGN